MSMTDTLRKVLMAGIGAVATTADKAQEVIEELVKKGQITVDEGKEILNDFTNKTVKPAINFVKRDEYEELKARVEELEKKVNMPHVTDANNDGGNQQ